MAKKGISLFISDDGEKVSYSEGYEVKDSVFVELRDLFESYKKDRDPEILVAMEAIIDQVPDRERRETHIGAGELTLLKEIWNWETESVKNPSSMLP